jgi:hypothetical protein
MGRDDPQEVERRILDYLAAATQIARERLNVTPQTQ